MRAGSQARASSSSGFAPSQTESLLATWNGASPRSGRARATPPPVSRISGSSSENMTSGARRPARCVRTMSPR